MSELEDRLRPLVGIVGGAIIGGTLYAFGRGILPGQLAFGSAVVGALSGFGARLFGAIGSPAQLRVLVFGSLFATVIGEYAAFRALEPLASSFAGHLVGDPSWLAFTVAFLVAGIFFGVRVLVGGDPLSDVLTHGGATVPKGATGSECPRCGSVQTARVKAGMACQACDHAWRVER